MIKTKTFNDLLGGSNNSIKKLPKRIRLKTIKEDAPLLEGMDNEVLEEDTLGAQKSPQLNPQKREEEFNTEIFDSLNEPTQQLNEQPKLPKQYDIYAKIKEEETEILGLEKRSLLFKINQYKELFKKELKDFKIKQNASIQELEQYLKEAEVIVNINSVEGFIIDSILNCILIIEKSLKNRSKYDISGTAELLQKNEQFNKLCKQLMIKYKIFASVPPEYQLIFIISTTAMICIKKNSQKDISTNLDKEIPKDEE